MTPEVTPQQIDAARSGDRAALSVIYEAHRARLVTFLARFAPEDAEDLVQELFVKLPDRLQSYDERGAFGRWLKGVAFNLYRTHQRSVNRRREEDLVGNDVPPPPPPMGVVTREDLMRHAIAGLPLGLREAWFLHQEGYEAREIAELIGITPNAAAARLSRARQVLAERLQALG